MKLFGRFYDEHRQNDALIHNDAQLIFRRFFRQCGFRMTDFSMKLHGVWAILCWNTFLTLYFSRRLQTISARYKDIEGFKFGYGDIKRFSC